MGYILGCVSLLLVTLAVVIASRAPGFTSCRTVAEDFVKRVGVPSDGPVSPVSGNSLTECSSTLQHTGGLSCCTSGMESAFLFASEDYLGQQISNSNRQLKQRIIQSLHLLQKYLRLSVQDAQNKTAETLSSLYRIPHTVYSNVIGSFFHQLAGYLTGSDEIHVTKSVDSFFKNLFPFVFNYVLSDPSITMTHRGEFDECLVKFYDEIRPFGDVPKFWGRNVRHGLQHVRCYVESLQVMVDSIDATGNFTVPKDCRKAISRLQFCSLCSGEVETRPCRGLCLNVMRGCLSGVAEISTSWNELVGAVQKLDFEKVWGSSGHEMLRYLDGNLTEALMKAMEEGPRIFTRVMALCRDTTTSAVEPGLYRNFPQPARLPLSHPTTRVLAIRKDITALLTQLEESKGFLQRIADGLCRVPAVYDQEMRSDQCWNGSAVGRYMREVPEANVISQAKDNIEVKVTLIPDPLLLQVKDTLVHMKRNLSILHNQEPMQNDQAYKTMASSGGYGEGRDVTIDDEDFAEGHSGSGSGYGPDDDDGDDEPRHHGDKPNYTPRPISDTGRGQGSFTPGSGGTGGGSGGTGGGSRQGDNRDKSHRGGHKPSSSSSLSIPPLILLLICVVLSRTSS